jgi:hypothetical protein
VLRIRIEHVLTGRVPDPHAMAGAASGGRAPHLPIVREAVASGLNAVYAVSAALGLAAGIITLALIRRPAKTPEPQPEPATVSA